MGSNVYWRDALNGEQKIEVDRFGWVCDGARVFWHGQESVEAHRALKATVESRPTHERTPNDGKRTHSAS